jgi:hypothetical protein
MLRTSPIYKDFSCNYYSVPLGKDQAKSFLGAFAKLRKEMIAWSCLTVCQSVRMQKLDSHWIDFYQI